MADTAVSCERISVRFTSERGTVTALDNIDLAIPRGSFLTLLGPSGCGKSTLLRVMADLVEPSSGRVSVLGGTPQAAREARQIGFVFQDPALLAWRTVLENVSLPLEVGGRASKESKERAHERADQFLRMVGLYDFKDKLPHELSGGMQQRAGIVRALVHDPTVLLMDEPFGAVDVLTREKLNVEIQALWEQTRKTIVFVTHSIQEAVFLSDVIFVFSPRPGTIVKVVEIDLPRPRTRATIHTPEFFEYEELVREHVKETID